MRRPCWRGDRTSWSSGLLPATVAVLAGSVPQAVLVVQAVATAIALRWGSSTETRTLMDRLAEAQEASGGARK